MCDIGCYMCDKVYVSDICTGYVRDIGWLMTYGTLQYIRRSHQIGNTRTLSGKYFIDTDFDQWEFCVVWAIQPRPQARL